MGGLKADYKVVVSGDNKLTAARLQDALNSLHAAGVPDWAGVEVNRSPGRESFCWAVVAKWDPQAPAAAAAPWNAEAAARKVQEQQARRVQDSPQA